MVFPRILVVLSYLVAVQGFFGHSYRQQFNPYGFVKQMPENTFGGLIPDVISNVLGRGKCKCPCEMVVNDFPIIIKNSSK